MTETPQIKGYQFDAFFLDLELRKLFAADRPIKLNTKAFDILHLLLERSGSVVEKSQLLERVWPNRIVEEGNLSVHIFSLRKILKAESPDSNYIETVPGSGYRFIARVAEVPGSVPAPVRGAPAGDNPTRTFNLAVLPLREIGKPVEAEYFADGFTESLINSLSRLPALRVLSSNTVFRYKDVSDSALSIGQALGVDAIVTGSISSESDRLLVDIELVCLGASDKIWKKQFTGSAFETFKIQESITLSIVQQLQVQLTKTEKSSLAHQATVDLEAYRHFLRGQFLLTRRNRVNLHKAIECFRDAANHDPNYTQAFTSIADAYMMLSAMGSEPCADTLLPAQRAIEQAVATGPDLAETHSSRGLFKVVYRIEWTKAEADFGRSIELEPSSVRNLSRYAMLLNWKGRFAECREIIHRALAVDPLSFYLYGLLGDSYYFTGDYDRAVAIAHEVLSLDPNDYMSLYLLGKSLSQMNDHEEALATLEKAFLQEPHPEIATEICLTHARAGRLSRARAALAELRQMAGNRYVEAFDFALIHAALAQPDRAFHFLNLALEERSLLLLSIRWDPRCASLRDDPRYDQVIRQIGFAD